MTDFNFFYLVEVRYGDLDPQGHVNNAKFLTYFEQTRVHYLIHLGLFEKDRSFMDVGIILAEARLTFKAPILWGQPIQVGVRVTRLGNKSFDFIYTIEDTQSGLELATGSTVQVAYNYHTKETIPIPENWREIITTFERLGR